MTEADNTPIEFNEFARLVFIPSGLDRTFRLVERGKEILQHQTEFWKRYSQIEDAYAKSLQGLLAQPCATWELKEGIFSKKKKLNESGPILQQGWSSVKNSVKEIAMRHEQISGALLKQCCAPLESLHQKLDVEIRESMELFETSVTGMKMNFKNLQKARQQYIKLAQSLKGISKLLDDPQLSYEKRQKLEIQSSQLKTEVDVALKAYKTLVDEIGMEQRTHFVEEAPAILRKFENLERERVSKTKNTYSKYVANAYTIIPTTRELCDKLIFVTDQMSPEKQISQYVRSVLSNLKEPIKAPRVPRFKPFGDVNEDDMDDPEIVERFEKDIVDVKSIYHITLEKEIRKENNNTKVKKEPLFTKSKEENDEESNSNSAASSDVFDDLIHPEAVKEQEDDKNEAEVKEEETISSEEVSSTEDIGIKVEPRIAESKEEENIRDSTGSLPEPEHISLFDDDEDPLDEITKLKNQLNEILQENDYYALLKVKPSDSLATITKSRKDINNRLHPDNFDPHSTAKQKAVDKLVKVNDVYSSVFRNEKTKILYDKLCAYRKKYESLLDAPDELLQRAVTNLNLVGKTVQKANFPEDLYKEVNLVLELIQKARNISPQ